MQRVQNEDTFIEKNKLLRDFKEIKKEARVEDVSFWGDK